MADIALGLIGCGYWGPKVLRAAASLPAFTVAAVIDSDLERARSLQRQFPAAVAATSLDEALELTDLRAVVVATNAASHTELAEHAFERKLHLLVEKPLALSAGDCVRLGALAGDAGRVLMVGHTFRFSPPVELVKQLIDQGDLGEMYYIDSQRLNLGRVRQDVDAIWNFAPHDISIVNHWVGRLPNTVRCVGHEYLQKGISDVGFLTLDYGEGVAAHIHVSWLSPQKVRHMTVVGSRKMVVYDDVATDDKIIVHDAGIDREHVQKSFPEFDTFAEFQLIQRLGDLHVPRLRTVEPLVEQCRHFAECIETGSAPITGFEEGAAVVSTLEAASASLLEGGEPVPVERIAVNQT